jgi:hypothetical protein
MSAKYSASTGGIYPLSIYQSFPEDALDIPLGLYESYQRGDISRFDVVNGVVVEYVPPVKTIEQIRATMKTSAWQFRRALTQLGWRNSVEAGVASADQDTKDMWEYSPTIERLHPFVVSMAIDLGRSDEEVDAVFTLANSFVQ